MRRFLRIGVAVVAACSWDDEPACPEGGLARIIPFEAVLFVGDTTTLTFQFCRECIYGQSCSQPRAGWRSDDTLVAQVTSGGSQALLRAVGAGRTMVHATSVDPINRGSQAEETITVTVRALPAAGGV